MVKYKKRKNINLQTLLKDLHEHCELGECIGTAKYWILIEKKLLKICDYHYRFLQELKNSQLIDMIQKRYLLDEYDEETEF